ncbi:transcription factor MYB48-like [Vicia villosa]|uniref:transcription factor MYB48-like n=1 Tax=Vicia villosa TaxID=3911 RepID=UPI00273AE05C|nr:transcription factor MYB48-like [Vicia villosa]
MVQSEEVRKGPWTEQEDFKLVSFVGLFGDRRWDFIAKVSGLNRTGKSCRLRWVNYLHPGLKRGKMTPHEERLVLELQSKWGNRWSRIARKLPGRTDNEIKNYWRTHMRKKAQDKKRNSSAPCIEHHVSKDAEETSFYDTGGSRVSTQVKQHEQEEISMDDIWKDIDISEENSGLENEEFCNDNNNKNNNNISCSLPMSSSSWEYNSSNSLWVMDEESMLFPKSDDPYFSYYANY